MTKKITTLLLFSTFLWSTARAQILREDENTKLGIQVGLSFSSVFGGELDNPTLLTGFTAGVYHKIPLSDKMMFMYELNASFQGSNFNNSQDSNTYSKMSLLYANVPAVVMLRLNNSETAPLYFVAGLQASVLMKSSLLVGANPVPEEFGLPLKTMDYRAVGGFQWDFDRMGVRLISKYGLRNINDGIDYPDIDPAQGRGKDIKNFSIALSLLF